jgi:(p)ppGpp synthase/HD superfamily hydrolase
LLQRLEFDEELVAVGLLHDSVERGTLSESELRSKMGKVAGVRAVTVFVADKLSDIAGLRRGIENSH